MVVLPLDLRLELVDLPDHIAGIIEPVGLPPLDLRFAKELLCDRRANFGHEDEQDGAVDLAPIGELPFKEDLLSDLAEILLGVAEVLLGWLLILRRIVDHASVDLHRHDLDRVSATVVCATARAGTLVPLGVETPRIAFEALAVGAFDGLEREELVPADAAPELMPRHAAHTASQDVSEGLAVRDVLLRGEDGVVALLTAAYEWLAHSYSVADRLA